MQGVFARVQRAADRSPLEVSLWMVAITVTLFVLCVPLFSTRYPPMTDLPFHAAGASIFRHYGDPSFHFRDQFALRPFSVPYVMLYAVAALLMLVLPTMLAMKIAVAIMLGLVPAGLAVMFYGMKKSPLLGLLGLGMCWGNLTHWGFVNFVGALGLFPMSIGMTLLLLERPTRTKQLGLGLTLVAIYFTHVFRYPFALAAVIGTTIVMYPATRRVRPVLLPLLPAIALMVIWWKIRPPQLGDGLGPLSFHRERFGELFRVLVAGFHDPAEGRAFARYFNLVYVVGILGALSAAGRTFWLRRRITAWGVGVTLVPLACGMVFAALYFVLPLWIGPWFYVYPREATSAAIILFGLCPDLPRTPLLRAVAVMAMAVGGVGVANVVTRNYAQFSGASDDFYRISQKLPKAPKLFYLIFDHGGSTRTMTPFIHLPAYVQAEKGGWLGWHMAIWNAHPFTYRSSGEPGAVVPKPVLWGGWEWSPDRFNLQTMAPWYDWFLVRKSTSPDDVFKADPTIQQVDHVGMWWLYKRVQRK